MKISITAEDIPADVFETIHDEHTRFPFFETEDAQVIGGGHHDKAEFAALLTRYDHLMSGEDFETAPEDVEWRYALVTVKDGEWWFAWSKGNDPVKSDSPGAIAITLVRR